MAKRRTRRDRTPAVSLGLCLFFLVLFVTLAVFFVVVGLGLLGVLIEDGAGVSVGIARPTPVWFGLIGIVLGTAFCVAQAVDWGRALVGSVRAKRGAGPRHP